MKLIYVVIFTSDGTARAFSTWEKLQKSLGLTNLELEEGQPGFWMLNRKGGVQGVATVIETRLD